VVGAHTSVALKLWVVSPFVWAVAGSTTMSWHSFFEILTEDLTIRFIISSTRTYLRVSVTGLLLPKCYCSFSLVRLLLTSWTFVL
jgi:hypothetical protein